MIGMRLEEIVAELAACALVDGRNINFEELEIQWSVLTSVLFDADKPRTVLRTERLVRTSMMEDEA